MELVDTETQPKSADRVRPPLIDQISAYPVLSPQMTTRNTGNGRVEPTAGRGFAVAGRAHSTTSLRPMTTVPYSSRTGQLI